MANRVRVGIIGCGNIAASYAKSLVGSPNLTFVGVSDTDLGKAAALAAEHDLKVFSDLDALLAAGVDLIINLTIHHAHYQVTKRCLEFGAHVYSEKPLAMEAAEAQELVALARAQGVRLGASPFTFLGTAQQAALDLLHRGALGKLRLVYAEMNWARIETWHPNPAPFYEVGPLVDVGVYPLSFLTTALGPVRRVHAFGTTLYPNRTRQDGEAFRVSSPDFVTAMLEFDDAIWARLTCNFYVGQHSKQGGSAAEFHGDDGSLYLSSTVFPDATLEQAEFGGAYEPVALDREEELDWGAGVKDMVSALQADQPHRVTGEHAAHIVEVLGATQRAVASGGVVEVSSSFAPPLLRSR